MRKRVIIYPWVGTHQLQHPVPRSHARSRAPPTPILPLFSKRWWRNSTQRSRAGAGRPSAMFHDVPLLPPRHAFPVLSPSHRCFVIAAFVRLRLAYLSHPPPSLVTRPWVLRQNAHRPLEAEYTPSCCRPIISSRTLPTPSTRLHLHTNATPPTTPFVLFIPACFFIYSSRYIVSSPFCRPSWGTPMRGRGPPGYLALSSCTSFDIDVTLFANTLALNRLSRCPSWLKGRESVWVRGGSAKVVG